MRDDNLEPENNPVKHGITKSDHDRIRAAYFASKAQLQAEIAFWDAKTAVLRKMLDQR